MDAYLRGLRRQALRIFKAALKAADPYQAVLRHVRVEGDMLIVPPKKTYDLKSFRNIYVIGAGKASAQMGRAVERLLGARISGGLINVKDGHGAKLRRIEIHVCGHPVPDARGVAGARRIAQIASQAGVDDLIIFLLSGGASALLPLPAPGITLTEKQKTTRLLLHCGANIHELNCVRKHISRIKGGQLARMAHPAKMLSLILSDVIGDALDVIGSGPSVWDRSTFVDARAIFEKYQLWGKLPRSVHERVSVGADETPKPKDKLWKKMWHVVVGSNDLAVDAAADEARKLGYNTLVLSTYLNGEAREVARVHAAIASEIYVHGRPVPRPACVISGGETTVTIRGKGLGGRNQEFALAAAIEIAGWWGDVAILSAGTDGTDGPTDATGAIVDCRTVYRARELGLDAATFLANNDSYHIFEATGDLIKTGPTGTNVADIQIILVPVGWSTRAPP
jgi:glycerate 2-kinase